MSEFALAHLQWHRHRCLLWQGMALRFEFDDAPTGVAQHGGVAVGDLLVVRRGRGVVQSCVGGTVHVQMLKRVDAVAGDGPTYKLCEHSVKVAEGDIYGCLHHWQFELKRTRLSLDALDRDAVLAELLEFNGDDARKQALKLALTDDDNDDRLRDLLFGWLCGPSHGAAAAAVPA